MKKYKVILIVLFIMFLSGCTSNKYIQLPYSVQHAYSNNDIIDIQDGNKYYNVEKIEEFINCVKNGENKKVCIVKYHTGMDDRFDWDAPQQIFYLSYNGRYINLTRYSTNSIPSGGRIMKTDSIKYTAIDKVVTDEDIQYELVGDKNKKIVILSLVKNGFIDSKSQKYLDTVIKEN